MKFTARPSSSPVPLVVAAATSMVGAETQSGAANPAKVLPLRIGHGFDLHRLEPGYPLIIGGINIPHDRGCEAHSDGNSYLHIHTLIYAFSLFLFFLFFRLCL